VLVIINLFLSAFGTVIVSGRDKYFENGLQRRNVKCREVTRGSVEVMFDCETVCYSGERERPQPTRSQKTLLQVIT
jgi:hypothetical protein